MDRHDFKDFRKRWDLKQAEMAIIFGLADYQVISKIENEFLTISRAIKTKYTSYMWNIAEPGGVKRFKRFLKYMLKE